MVDQIMTLPERTKIQLLAPVVQRTEGRTCKGAGASQKERIMSGCRSTAICMSCPRRLSWRRISSILIEIVVDRLVVKPGIEKRLTDSIETVLGSIGRTCWWWM